MSKINTAKISRGENYKGLPYLVLDYPSVFTKNNILAFRTMFYWGNFFSITLHLQGDYLTLNRDVLHSKIAQLQALELFISTGNSPWQYHYSSDNYLPIAPLDKEKFFTDSFIKLSQRIPLNEYASLPDKAASFVRTFLEFLRTE